MRVERVRGGAFLAGSAWARLEQAIAAQAPRLAGPDVDLEAGNDAEPTLLTLAGRPRPGEAREATALGDAVADRPECGGYPERRAFSHH
ncbi:hypothetical protein [Amycolatopsis sp. FDAARGOS 1241]|uniref:hypothetical protein n=1 Tax=Amycolatopsis sp. FDAARGOS 1241 TaxID=2778070 RepID=UPI00195116F9|nr:hypothetical protein [Amycolatopsis sp. FDAARGOS 1241]QRP48736.1 hypothetical protein I6J71_13480 [Amycolatopsis sp. FDAARGOS 1241]